MEPGKRIFKRINYFKFYIFRSCIGQRFAKLELYMMMVKVVQKFHMEYTGEKVGLLTQFISVPDKSVNIRFTNR